MKQIAHMILEEQKGRQLFPKLWLDRVCKIYLPDVSVSKYKEEIMVFVFTIFTKLRNILSVFLMKHNLKFNYCFLFREKMQKKIADSGRDALCQMK